MGDYSEDIKKLYMTVFEKHKNEFRVDEWAIREGIRNLGIAYKPNPNWEYGGESISVNFNDAGHRCAYLFKYAMLHTGLVYDVLKQALNMYTVKQKMDYKQQLNLCSLGSGPGSDVVGLLLALKEKFGPKPCNVSLVDCSVQWEHVFESVVSELNTTESKIFISRKYITYEYIGCNLLAFNDDTHQAIKNADVVTMIKFLSAAACKDTRDMIKKICSAMKPGALLLFIDNAAGGFHEIMAKLTKLYGFKSVFEPLRHYDYEDQIFNIPLWNYNSQYKTRVTAEIWEKELPQNTTMQLQKQFFRLESHSNDFNGTSAHTQSFDEVDSNWAVPQCQTATFHERDQSFRLQVENDTESERDSGCCIIM